MLVGNYVPVTIIAVCALLLLWIFSGFPGITQKEEAGTPVTGQVIQTSWGTSYPGSVINPTPAPIPVYLSSETDPYWLGNYSNMVNSSCPAGNFSYGIDENGTILCRDNFEFDPFWSANYSNMLSVCPAGEYAYGMDSSGNWLCFNDSIGLTIEADPHWAANYTNMVLPCASGYYTEGIYANGSFICRVLPSSPTETDPYWAANYTNLVTPCSPGEYVEGIYSNGSLICSVLPIETDPYWAANYTNLVSSSCGAGQYASGVLSNGSFVCVSLPMLVEADPYWAANYTNMLVGCQTDEYAWGINLDGSVKCKNLTASSLEQNITVSVVSGNGIGYSTVILDYLIKQIIVTPTTSSNTYRFSAQENSTGGIIDRDRIQHTGVWNILKDFPIINSRIGLNVTGASMDENFSVTVRYWVRE